MQWPSTQRLQECAHRVPPGTTAQACSIPQRSPASYVMIQVQQMDTRALTAAQSAIQARHQRGSSARDARTSTFLARTARGVSKAATTVDQSLVTVRLAAVRRWARCTVPGVRWMTSGRSTGLARGMTQTMFARRGRASAQGAYADTCSTWAGAMTLPRFPGLAFVGSF